MKFSEAFRESTTLKFVTVTWVLLSVRFVAGGLGLEQFEVEATSMTEYATSVAAVLAIWLGREWRKAHYGSKRDESD